LDARQYRQARCASALVDDRNRQGARWVGDQLALSGLRRSAACNIRLSFGAPDRRCEREAATPIWLTRCSSDDQLRLLQ
jgi:hypothetical protein